MSSIKYEDYLALLRKEDETLRGMFDRLLKTRSSFQDKSILEIIVTVYVYYLHTNTDEGNVICFQLECKLQNT